MAEKKQILVVEDEPDMRAILVGMLEGAQDYTVIQAEDGQQALDTATSKKPDIILLDIMLPKLTGFEVLEKLKQNPDTQNIPVIILSNLGQDKEIEQGKQLGAVDYLTKSDVHLDEILAKIDKYTSGQPA